MIVELSGREKRSEERLPKKIWREEVGADVGKKSVWRMNRVVFPVVVLRQDSICTPVQYTKSQYAYTGTTRTAVPVDQVRYVRVYIYELYE